jgi:hypothetical protein
MAFVPVAIFVVIVLGFLIGGIVHARRVRRSFEGQCRAVAETLGGEFFPATFNRYPQIVFFVEGRHAVLVIDNGRDASSYVRIDFEGGPGTMKIFEESFGQSVLKFFGAQDLAVGDATFDATYVIQANPPSLAGRIFSPERRARVMESVWRLKGYQRPVIELANDALVVRVQNRLTQQYYLRQLAATAIEFAGYLLHLDPAEGILWMESRGAPGRCPICVSALSDGVVHCPLCRTPHHEECWRYAGQCSTYACSGTRYVA